MTTRLNGGTIPPPQGAPVIFIDPTNPYAAHLLMDYAARLEETGRPLLAAAARKHAAEIQVWQATHGVAALTDPANTTTSTTSKKS